jgi:hypothetical protein
MSIIQLLIGFGVGLVLGGAIAGVSESYDGISLDEAASIFKDTGMPAIRKTSTSGEPYIGSNVGGSDFEAHFYSCIGDKKDEKCKDMALFFSVPVRNASLEPLNYWNGKSRVTKAYLNDQRNLAYLRMDIHLRGDVGKGNIEYYLNAWKELMPSFLGYLQTGRLKM